eukprot:s873_g24.t1
MPLQRCGQSRWFWEWMLLEVQMDGCPWRLTGLNIRAKVEKGTKGKSKDKGSAKGKSGGKNKGKDNKGKSKGGDQKGAKGGGAGDRPKGKGKGDSKQCYIRGRAGHFARDCWHSQVSNVSAETTNVSAVQGSFSSSVDGMSSVSQSGAQTSIPTQTTQQRVARICEAGDDAKHVGLVFDLRDFMSSSFSGNVHVVPFFIGDVDDSLGLSGHVRVSSHVRADVSKVSDDAEQDQTFTILLDSGAGSSICLVSLLEKGRPSSGTINKLCDAQGTEIPMEAVQDMEIGVKDVTGKTLLFRERVAASVNQPILYSALDACWKEAGQLMANSRHSHMGVVQTFQLSCKTNLSWCRAAFVFCMRWFSDVTMSLQFSNSNALLQEHVKVWGRRQEWQALLPTTMATLWQKSLLPESEHLHVLWVQWKEAVHDADAEAVIKYAEQEKQAEEEQFAMAKHDPIQLQVQVEDKPEDQQKIFEDEPQPNPGGAAAGSTDIDTPAVTHPLDSTAQDEVSKRAKWRMQRS